MHENLSLIHSCTLSLQAPRAVTGAAVSPKVAWLDEADLVHTPAEAAFYNCSFSQRMLQARADTLEPHCYVPSPCCLCAILLVPGLQIGQA